MESGWNNSNTGLRSETQWARERPPHDIHTGWTWQAYLPRLAQTYSCVRIGSTPAFHMVSDEGSCGTWVSPFTWGRPVLFYKRSAALHLSLLSVLSSSRLSSSAHAPTPMCVHVWMYECVSAGMHACLHVWRSSWGQSQSPPWARVPC